jgi:hypothetical protein
MSDSSCGELNAFLINNGFSLADYGSSEFGLNRADSIAFLELLFKNMRTPLGIEVWRRHGNRFVIDSLGGWYCESFELNTAIKSAKEFLTSSIFSDDDLMTIQFD